MSQPSLLLIPFGSGAVPGTINTVPNTRTSGVPPQAATWTDGFPLVTMTPLAAGGIPPQGQDFNGVLNAISLHTVFVGHGGQYKFSSTYVAAAGGYSIGDVIQSNDGLNSYVSLVNTNTIDFNATPSSIGTSWGIWAGSNTQTQATEAVSGIAKVATQVQTNAGSIDTAMVTPKKLAAANQAGVFSFATDTGTANAYVCAFTPAITARSEAAPLRFKVNASNTGASTLNDGLGAVPLVGGAHVALQGGELFATGDAWVQWNASVGTGSYILLFCTGAPEQVGAATKSQHAAQFGQVSGVVGHARNLKMSVATASATATLTADEVVVETALGGLRYCLASFSKTINLATTGVGGMDTGTAPVSGFVALYAIYNPTTATAALLAVNATSSAAPNVYGGANMPAGYTASALVSVVATNGSSQFSAGQFQTERKVVFTPISVAISVTNQPTFISLSLASAVPLNAKFASLTMQAQSTAAGLGVFQIASDANGTDAAQVSAGPVTQIGAMARDVMLITPQTVWRINNLNAGTTSFTLNVVNYTF